MLKYRELEASQERQLDSLDLSADQTKELDELIASLRRGIGFSPHVSKRVERELPVEGKQLVEGELKK